MSVARPPGDDHDDREARVREHRHDRHRDRENDAEQHGEAVELARADRQPHRVGGVPERERRVLVGQQEQVGPSPGVPPQVAGQVGRREARQPSGHQRAEPPDDHDGECRDPEEGQGEKVRNRQDEADRHGDPALGGRPGDRHPDRPRGISAVLLPRSRYRRIGSHFSHSGSPAAPQSPPSPWPLGETRQL